MQQLRDKLAIVERAAKSEAQLKVLIWFPINAYLYVIFIFGMLDKVLFTFF